MEKEDVYPVFNSGVRPGLGKDLAGNLFSNTFTIHLPKKDTGEYIPFLYTDFLRQFNAYSKYLGTCKKCILCNGTTFLPCNNLNIDLCAFDRKFSSFEDEIDPDVYKYCPLICQFYKNATFEIHNTNDISFKVKTDIVPLDAVIEFNHDDPYLFQLNQLNILPSLNLCPAFQIFYSKEHIGSKAEQNFFGLWFQSMFRIMGDLGSKKNIFLGRDEVEYEKSLLLRFVFPIPQTWVQVIPPPPPDVSWREWNNVHRERNQPQRVDFLFVYRGKRHVVEIDGHTHYKTEAAYRRSLIQERWLKVSGYEVHRITNQEINDLFQKRLENPYGFIHLLEMMDINPEELVFTNES